MSEQGNQAFDDSPGNNSLRLPPQTKFGIDVL